MTGAKRLIATDRAKSPVTGGPGRRIMPRRRRPAEEGGQMSEAKDFVAIVRELGPGSPRGRPSTTPPIRS